MSDVTPMTDYSSGEDQGCPERDGAGGIGRGRSATSRAAR